jgi:hypothetical protein
LATLTETLDTIGKDIVQVLKDNGNKPMTDDQLFANRKLMNYSEFGWGFAIEKLEKKKIITSIWTRGVESPKYKLVNP